MVVGVAWTYAPITAQLPEVGVNTGRGASVNGLLNVTVHWLPTVCHSFSYTYTPQVSSGCIKLLEKYWPALRRRFGGGCDLLA